VITKTPFQALISRSFVAKQSERLDQAIASALPQISRRAARRFIESCSVLVNHHPVRVASRRLQPGEHVAIVTHPIDIPVIKATPAWIAVNKPHELATQPTKERERVSLIELLRLSLKKEGARDDLFVVHRLDVGTSGVLLFARDRATAARLSSNFARGESTKTYLACVDGIVAAELLIDTPLNHAGDQNRSTTSPTGKSARTTVTPRKILDDHSVVEITIDSGRTHQIRAHLASAGHPILGDSKYAPASIHDAAPRLMLHAWKLETGLTGELIASPPDDFL